jgi:hypothetical protein
MGLGDFDIFFPILKKNKTIDCMVIFFHGAHFLVKALAT